MTFIAIALILLPLVVLIGAAVATYRINRRAGGQVTQLTYRAYGA